MVNKAKNSNSYYDLSTKEEITFLLIYTNLSSPEMQEGEIKLQLLKS